MNWRKVSLIFFRELRDQLRDRRTLFTIAVLPMLLYPLLGMTIFQVIQFKREHSANVAIVGLENLPPDAELLEDGKFSREFCSEQQAELLNAYSDFELSEDSLKAIKDSAGSASPDSATRHP